MNEHDDLKPHDFGYIAYDSIKKDIRVLGNYLDTVEIYIDELLKEYTAKENAHKPEGDQDYAPSEWVTDIVQQIRVSFIMLLFSSFEKNIDLFCDAVSKRKRLPIERKDITGGILASSKKYLEVFGNFDFNYIKSWDHIVGLYDVRNIFVHGGGDKNKARLGTERRLNSLIKLDIGLSEHNNQISISNNKFCYFALESINDFFYDLICYYHDNLGAGFWVVK